MISASSKRVSNASSVHQIKLILQPRVSFWFPQMASLKTVWYTVTTCDTWKWLWEWKMTNKYYFERNKIGESKDISNICTVRMKWCKVKINIEPKSRTNSGAPYFFPRKNCPIWYLSHMKHFVFFISILYNIFEELLNFRFTQYLISTRENIFSELTVFLLI